MTDKELLELAARAAGIEGEYAELHQSCGDQLVRGIDEGCLPVWWCPLDDDGDALRLAVKIGIDILRTETVVEAIAALPPYINIQTEPPVAPFGIELIGNDAYAATRRAIVRAAAEIGSKMP
jgi:hypothetical protein